MLSSSLFKSNLIFGPLHLPICPYVCHFLHNWLIFCMKLEVNKGRRVVLICLENYHLAQIKIFFIICQNWMIFFWKQKGDNVWNQQAPFSCLRKFWFSSYTVMINLNIAAANISSNTKQNSKQISNGPKLTKINIFQYFLGLSSESLSSESSVV